MSSRTSRLSRGSALAAALLCASVACAEPPAVTPVMQRAFAALEQGPDQFRWFMYRAGIIYNLGYAEVIAAYVATRMADLRPPVAESLVATAARDRT
jgi:hypothetical protein